MFKNRFEKAEWDEDESPSTIVRQRSPRQQTRNWLRYFQDGTYFNNFTSAFRCDGIQIGQYAPSLLPAIGERGVFMLSQKTDGLYYRICKFHKHQKKTYRTFLLPHLYMLIHGADPDAEQSNVMLLTWTRRLLHDAEICPVKRTPFRVPFDGVKKLFMSAREKREEEHNKKISTPAEWPLAVMLLNGLGLLVDLEPEPRFVPYTAEFALHWASTHSYFIERNVCQERAVQIILGLRQKLIRAGLIEFRKETPRCSKFRPAPVTTDGLVMNADKLYQRWHL